MFPLPSRVHNGYRALSKPLCSFRQPQLSHGVKTFRQRATNALVEHVRICSDTMAGPSAMCKSRVLDRARSEGPIGVA